MHPGDPKLIKLDRDMRAEGDAEWRNHTVPLMVHGDGGMFSRKNSDSLVSVQFKSWLAATFRTFIFPIWAVVKSASTLECRLTLWQETVHCFNSMFLGVHHSVDSYGAPVTGEMAKLAGTAICGGLKFVVWICNPDLEYLSNELKYPHFNSNRPCWNCSVENFEGARLPMTDLSTTAGWLSTILTTEESICCPCTDHPIGSLHGTCRHMAPGDVMHSGDLGLLLSLLGGTCHELVYDGTFEGTEQARCGELWSLIQAKYTARNTESRMTAFTLQHFKATNDFNELRHTKAAISQCLLFVMREILEGLNTYSDRDRHRLQCYEDICHIYNTWKNADRFLTDAEADDCMACYKSFCEHYAWLLQYSLGKGHMNYGIKFKMHSFYHIVESSRWQNPRFCWNYEFEDWMMTVLSMAKAAMPGSPMHIIGNKVLQNAYVVLDLQLKDGFCLV